MKRRSFLKFAPAMAAAGIAAPAFAQAPFADEKSKLKITGVRLVQTGRAGPCRRTRPRRDRGRRTGRSRQPDVDLSRVQGARDRSFSRDPGKVRALTVEITTDKGIKGTAAAAPAAATLSRSI